jgi:nitric oxide reductase subunit C
MSEKVLTNKNRWVMATLIVIFIIYNSIVYTQGTSNNTPKMSTLAIEGEQLFQDKNCIACHQLFGLGGYLGPDLTNIISTENKGHLYTKAFLNSGIKQMPKFNFTEKEQDALVQFLTEVDHCGYYPIYDAKTESSGWVKVKYKNQ